MEQDVPGALEESPMMNQLINMSAAYGLPRAAGRILSHLMLTGAPVSRAAIGERLLLSRAGVSANTRLLLEMGLIRRITIPGTRDDGFEVPADVWQRQLENRIVTLGRQHREIREILSRVVSEPLQTLDAALALLIAAEQKALQELEPGTERQTMNAAR